ncbi:type III-B CRISPR module-associated Cmr3 family protein [Saccharopolyspora flava]|uniref:CRISPR-associated protein Cmr3 n=1 Tax=Saccharopolyspora flava TaxID=95161 RepID=A0A1I6UJY9_9PSEU|nr:type III-B CRISPR module-associated Cmr3 family protein [Saccharopolyspora flava]SFT01775.1 CRISPR-associated protein Cmr3 [Saccharopolyspora flava]
MDTTWLSIEPLDTLMVRDGRTFAPGEGVRGEATTPPPSTFGGAVHQALQRDVSHRIVGPVVRVNGTPQFPTPADLVVDDRGNLDRLNVVERPAGITTDLDERKVFSHVLDGEGQPRGGWFTRSGMEAWLSGDVATGTDDPAEHLGEDPWRTESRLGLTRETSGRYRDTAAKSLLYLADHLRPADGMSFLVGCEDDQPIDEPVTDVVRLGGLGRKATVRKHPYGSPMPSAPKRFPGGRMTVYLATPALLNDVFWHPSNAELCAVALTGPTPLASASWRNGVDRTKLLRWAVPAGSVYYLKFSTEQDALRWSADHHGTLLPDGAQGERGEHGETRIATAGFGTCLTGSW